MTEQPELYVIHPTRGHLAYLDTFSGLVPCKALRTEAETVNGHHMVTVRLTATRGAYKRGEILTIHQDNVVPRDRVFTRDHILRIRGGWVWVW